MKETKGKAKMETKMKRFGHLWIGQHNGVTINAFKSYNGRWIAKASHPWGGQIFTQGHKTKASAVAYVVRELSN